MKPKRVFVELTDPTQLGGVVDALNNLGQSLIYRGRVDALLKSEYDLTFPVYPESQVELDNYLVALNAIEGVSKVVLMEEPEQVSIKA